MAPWEKGPDIAADPLLTPEQLVDALADAAAERAGLEAIAARIPAASRDRVYALVQDRDGLSEAAVDELTTLVAPVLAGDPDELDDPGIAPSPAQLRAVWSQMPGMEAGGVSSDVGGLADGGGGDVAAPAAGGLRRRAGASGGALLRSQGDVIRTRVSALAGSKSPLTYTTGSPASVQLGTTSTDPPSSPAAINSARSRYARTTARS